MQGRMTSSTSNRCSFSSLGQGLILGSNITATVFAKVATSPEAVESGRHDFSTYSQGCGNPCERRVFVVGMCDMFCSSETGDIRGTCNALRSQSILEIAALSSSVRCFEERLEAMSYRDIPGYPFISRQELLGSLRGRIIHDRVLILLWTFGKNTITAVRYWNHPDLVQGGHGDLHLPGSDVGLRESSDVLALLEVVPGMHLSLQVLAMLCALCVVRNASGTGGSWQLQKVVYLVSLTCHGTACDGCVI